MMLRRRVVEEGLPRISRMTMTMTMIITAPFSKARVSFPQFERVEYRFGIASYYCRRLKIQFTSSLSSYSAMSARCSMKYRFGSSELVGFRCLPSLLSSSSSSPSSCSGAVKFNKSYSVMPAADCDGGNTSWRMTTVSCERSRRSSTVVAPQCSRMARVEAQKVLLDYLLGTSALQFPDAEHISKNSPKFLSKLISKVVGGADDEEEVGRSIRKFLRYNPINEFEPFFESLGIKESDIPNVLPSSLVFLRDDETMLEIYRLLCNYGVPRSRIGKMFVEEHKIFRYEPAELMAHLEAYEKLGLSIPAVIKLVSCCPSLLVGGVDNDFVDVFKRMTALGFGDYWITRSLSESNIYRWSTVMQTLDFLHEMSCSKEDVKILITKHPWFLFNESGRKVYVITAILMKLGLKMNEILSLILRNPQIMSGRFVKNLYQSIQFLSEIGMREGEIAATICSHPDSMGRCMLKTPRYVLSSLGVDQHELCNIIKKDPYQLVNLAAKNKLTTTLAASNRAHPLEKTNFLLKLGLVENSDDMAVAQKRFRGRGDQLQERFDTLVNAGLSFRDACNLVKAAPQVLNQTVDVLEKKIDYLVNYAGYPLDSLIIFPTYLAYNLDRIKTRFSMIQWLKEKGVVKPTLSPSSVIASSRERFKRLYVNLLPEGCDVWDRLNQSS